MIAGFVDAAAGLPAGCATAGFVGAVAGFVAVVGAPGFTVAEEDFAAGAAGFGLKGAELLAAAGFVATLAGVFEPSDLVSDFEGWLAVEGLMVSFSFNSLTGSF